MPTPEERFTALFDATHRPLLAYAIRRVADPADAADVVAETFLVAWRRLDEVPPGDHARPWLFGVARRVLANLYRGERRRHALADRLRESLTEIAPPDRTELSDVEIALGKLDDDDRELLRLVAWEDLARDEIAIALGVSRAAVRVRLHRARQRLLQQMAALAEPAPAEVKRPTTTGHVVNGWAAARPGVEEVR
ncbi:RNA polymerase sigma factor [Cellulomonas sp. URHD0024]|uniref:RNA polymerase sigma factor n=1 Tax=Cellulomonas sp. URHD0024 TaxID=1302620 RepID=UPI00042102F3|nr:sigma-70 family RNA polymerase sigma factor [Cellulomonas sp. URHD0024]